MYNHGLDKINETKNKNDDTPWLDWDLKNTAGEQVASGVYIAHLEMPHIGEKVMKVAVILENVR